MKAGQLLKIVAEVIALLERNGLIDTNGDFVEPDVQQIVTLAAGVEAILKAHGVQTPDKLDKVIQLIPLVWAIAK